MPEITGHAQRESQEAVKAAVVEASLLSIPIVNRPVETEEYNVYLNNDIRSSFHCSHVFPSSSSKVCARCGVAALPLSTKNHMSASTILDRDLINETLAAIKHNTASLKSAGDALERQCFAIESINIRNASEVDTRRQCSVPKKIQKPVDPPLFSALESSAAKESGSVSSPPGHALKKEAGAPRPRDPISQAILWSNSNHSSEIAVSSLPVGAIWNSDSLSPNNERRDGGLEGGGEKTVSGGQLQIPDDKTGANGSRNVNNSYSDILQENDSIIADPNKTKSVSLSNPEDDQWMFVKFWPHRMAESFKMISTSLKNGIDSCNFDVRCRFPIRHTKDLASSLGATIAEANRKLTWINERQTHFYLCLEQVRFSSFEDLSIVLDKLVEKADGHPSAGKHSQITSDSISNLEAREIDLIVKLR
jgi:hypothetical protein